MPVYNAVLRFLLKRLYLHLHRVAAAAEEKFVRMAEIIEPRSHNREDIRVRYLFPSSPHISVSFMQVDSLFARASIFIQLSSRRRCIL